MGGLLYFFQLEGNYSNYTLLATLVIPTGTNYPLLQPTFTNRNTQCLYTDNSNNLILITVSPTPAIADTEIDIKKMLGSSQVFQGFSIAGKYQVFFDDFSESIMSIYKDGILIKQNTLAGASDYYQCFGVSPNGQYILACYWDDSETTYNWEIWQGS